jgi:DNA-binding FadR family transcriptional regulator
LVRPITDIWEKLVSTAANNCFESIRRGIITGRYSPGERLPAERKLAENLGVNRVTVRSALTRLASAKLVTVRQGSGYVVQDYRRSGGPDLLPGIARLAMKMGAFHHVARDLLLVRRHLAAAVLERLAQRPPTANDLTRITAAVDAFADVVNAGADPSTLAERDMDIVAALLEATGSSVLGLCLNPITAVLKELPLLRNAIYTQPEANLFGWRAMLAWLADPSLLPVELLVAQLIERDDSTIDTLSQSPEIP